MEPACAKACPTQSIQFGPLDELRETAQKREAQLHAQGVKEAHLYGADDDGVRRAQRVLPADGQAGGLQAAQRRKRRAARAGTTQAATSGVLVTAVLGVFAALIARRQRNRRGGGGRPGMTSFAQAQHFAGNPDWTWYILAYFFLAGLAGGSYFLAAFLRHWGTPADEPAARLGFYVALPATLVCPVLLTLDLAKPLRFWHMLVNTTPGSFGLNFNSGRRCRSASGRCSSPRSSSSFPSSTRSCATASSATRSPAG